MASKFSNENIIAIASPDKSNNCAIYSISNITEIGSVLVKAESNNTPIMYLMATTLLGQAMISANHLLSKVEMKNVKLAEGYKRCSCKSSCHKCNHGIICTLEHGPVTHISPEDYMKTTSAPITAPVPEPIAATPVIVSAPVVVEEKPWIQPVLDTTPKKYVQLSLLF
jgi:hypothetical protein